MSIRRRHWLAAVFVAAVVHGSLILLLWEPTRSGAANPGVGGMDVSFGMAGGAPGATAVTPPAAKAVDAPEKAVVEPVAPPTAETAEVKAPLEAVEPHEPQEVEAVAPPSAEAVPVSEVTPKMELAQVPTKPTPPREAKSEIAKPVPAATQLTASEAAAPEDVASTEPPQTQPSTDTATVAGSAGKSGTKNAAHVGHEANTTSGGRPGSADNYFARLQAWLEQHKEYPSAARRRRQEGTAVLTFTMNRGGDVMAVRIQRGTGYRALDEEVIRMITRAAPLPPLPDDFAQDKLTLSVPVQFQLY